MTCGYQTLDGNLKGKATVILNSDGSWDPFFTVLNRLHSLGTIGQNYRDFLVVAESPRAVLPALNRVRAQGLPVARNGHVEGPGWGGESFEGPLPENHNGNVCVFCSASLKDPDYLGGRTLGRLLAASGLGCVSGAGSSGVMGEVVRGAVEAGAGPADRMSLTSSNSRACRTASPASGCDRTSTPGWKS